MCANRTRPAIGAATFLLLALAGTAFAQAPQVDHLGAHRFRGMEEFQQVIDARCTICHTRERVDIAIKKRRALEKIERRMIKRGAIITEQDRSVLGTFWGNPMKEKTLPSQP